MKLLFVHQQLGALGGAEANIHLTAREFQRRGHRLALLRATARSRPSPLQRPLFSNFVNDYPGKEL